MRQKKILFGLLLAFALLLGGAYALYTRLGQSMAPGRLAGAGGFGERFRFSVPADARP